MAAKSRLILPPLPTIRDLLQMYELRARKSLSQNFLMHMNLCKKIVKKSGISKDSYVCEIGPGPGGISRAILEQDVAQLDVIEKDGRFLPSLEQLASASENKMRIHHADVLRFNTFDKIFPDNVKRSWYDEPPNVYLIGNLPFNVATPLLIDLLRHISNRSGPFVYGRSRLTLTFQKEVGERIVAGLSQEQRCRLSVMCQHLAKVKVKMTIPGEAFVPEPKIEVAVVNFEPLEESLIPLNFKLVEKFCRHFFHHRQKYCLKNLLTLFPDDSAKKYADEMLRKARVNPTLPCYDIDISEIRDLCFIYENICNQVPGLFYYDYSKKHITLEQLVESGLKYPPEYPFSQKDFEKL